MGDGLNASLGFWRVSALAMCSLLALSCAPTAEPSAAPTPPPPIRRACVDPSASPECCPLTWLPLRDGGCAPRSLACASPTRAIAGACDAPVDRSDPVAAFWSWDERNDGPAWFAPWTCPTGWRALPDGTCAPTTNPSCAADEPALPDGTCVPVGLARCPSTEFPPVPEEAARHRVVYVREGAPDDAPGTLDAPMGDVARAIERAGDDGAVLVAAGTYRVSTTLHGRHRVVGVCAARVTLHRMGEDHLAGVFFVAGSGASLTVEGATLDTEVYHIHAEAGGHITGRRLVLRGSNDLAAEIGGSIELADSWASASGRIIRDYGPGDGGMFSGQTGTVSLRNVVAQDGWRVYARYIGHASISLDNVAMRDFRDGVDVSDSTVEVRASVADGIPAPVFLSINGTLRIDGLSITHAASPPTNHLDAILAGNGCLVDLRRVRIENDRLPAIRVADEGTHATMQDIAIVAVGQMSGPCLQAESFATLDASRLRLEGCAGVGLLGLLGARVTAEDVLIRDARIDPEGNYGVGLAQVFGGELTARRVRIEGALLSGVGAMSFPPEVLQRIPWDVLWPPGRRFSEGQPHMTLQDLLVARANPDPSYPAAGILVAAGSDVRGERIAVTGQRGIGVAAVDDGFTRSALAGSLMRSFGVPPAQLPAVLLAIGSNLDGRSSLALDGLFVSRVDPWGVLIDFQSPHDQPNYRAAWSAYAAPGCAVSLRDAVLDGEGTTVRAVVSGGAVTLDRAVLSRYGSCALATLGSVPEATIASRDVSLRGSGGSAVCREATLPRVHLPLSPN